MAVWRVYLDAQGLKDRLGGELRKSAFFKVWEELCG